MKINELKKKADLTLKDINDGEIFRFRGQTSIYMMGFRAFNQEGTDKRLINLHTGKVILYPDKSSDSIVDIFPEARLILNPTPAIVEAIEEEGF